MMKHKKTTKEIKSLLRNVGSFSLSLTQEERNSLKRSIMQKRAKSRSLTPLPIASPYLHLFRPLVAACAFLLIVVPATFASQKSLPGEVLYGIKTNIVEKIPLLVKLSPESRAQYYSALTRERVEESVELLRAREFDPELRVTIEKRIEKHALSALESADEAIIDGEAEESLEATSDLIAILGAYAEVNDRGGFLSSEVLELSQGVIEAHEDNIREYLERSTEEEVSQVSQEILIEFKQMLEEDSVDPDTVADIKEVLIEAQEDLEGRGYEEAFETLVDADTEIEVKQTLEEILEQLEKEE